VLKDEYDVQDLLYALLRIFFDDVRPEEWTPSFAGKSLQTVDRKSVDLSSPKRAVNYQKNVQQSPFGVGNSLSPNRLLGISP
jgi:hypothetical protein